MIDDTSLELPPLYESLTWLTPLAKERAAHLVAFLSDPARTDVLDMGCGWGELVLLVLTSSPQARGRGVNVSSAFIDRARQQAVTRGLLDRVSLASMLGIEAQDSLAEAVICIGTSQMWGPPVEDAIPLDYAAALRGLQALVLPGGRLVYCEATWSATRGDADAPGVTETNSAFFRRPLAMIQVGQPAVIHL